MHFLSAWKSQQTPFAALQTSWWGVGPALREMQDLLPEKWDLFWANCGFAGLIQFGRKGKLCNFPERESIFLQSSFLPFMIQYNAYNDSCFHRDGSCNISPKELVTVDTQHGFKNLDCQTRMFNYHIFPLFICEICVQFFNWHNEIWTKIRPWLFLCIFFLWLAVGVFAFGGQRWYSFVSCAWIEMFNFSIGK